MATTVENLKTEFGVRHNLTEEQMNAIEAEGLALRRSYEPEALSFTDLVVRQPSVITQWFTQGYNSLAEKAEAEAKKPSAVTKFEISEGLLIERIALGGGGSLTAQRDIVKFYQDELSLSPAAAAQAAARKLNEFGLKLGSDKPASADFKLPKPVRKALKAAAAAGEIERPSKLPRSDKPNDLSNKSMNPYLLSADDPSRHAKIVALMRLPVLAQNLAKAAGCTLAGARISA
jgi:hypothetical protein